MSSDQKKNPQERQFPEVLQPKHKERTPVISPILAQTPFPHNHSQNKYTIVSSGNDTLELTIGGVVSVSDNYLGQYQLWEQLKTDYVVGDKYFTIQLGDKWFQLYPKSCGKYSFLFRNDEFGFIKVFHPNDWGSGVEHKQQIHLKLYSNYLHSVSEEQLIKDIYSYCSIFIEDIASAKILVSRGDLYVDISMGDSFFSSSDMDNVVTRTRFRDRWYDISGIEFSEPELALLDDFASGATHYNRGSAKLTDHPLLTPDLLSRMAKVSINHSNYSFGADRTIGGRNLQTSYFGNPKCSDLWCKFYDKTLESIKKDNNQIQQIWVDNGWNGSDKVCRVEFSMKRNFIKELDNGSYVDLVEYLKHKNVIWDYLTHNFIRMVSSRKENNIQLSENTEFWSLVQQTFDLPKESVVRKKNYLGKVNQLYRQALGCIKQATSLGMLDNEDYGFVQSMGDALKLSLTQSYHLGEILDRRKLLGVA